MAHASSFTATNKNYPGDAGAHPFLIRLARSDTAGEDGEWRLAGSLKAGDEVQTPTGDWIAVTHIERLKRAATVYNFEVADFHTYFIGCAGTLVHNTCPNPYGKAGGPAHQAEVANVAADIETRGLKAQTEYGVETLGGEKSKRFVDVIGRNSAGDIVEMHQIGRQTKSGLPVARERRAIADINAATGGSVPMFFHPYN